MHNHKIFRDFTLPKEKILKTAVQNLNTKLFPDGESVNLKTDKKWSFSNNSVGRIGIDHICQTIEGLLSHILSPLHFLAKGWVWMVYSLSKTEVHQMWFILLLMVNTVYSANKKKQVEDPKDLITTVSYSN